MAVKPLGSYLVEAGLLTPAQIEVALIDQAFTQMRFGEILAARGWVKQQTIDYLVQKVVLPERTTWTPPAATQSDQAFPQAPQPMVKASTQKLISANFPDHEITWVD